MFNIWLWSTWSSGLGSLNTHSCLSLNIRSKAGGWRHFLTWDCGQCPRHSGDHCLSSVCPKRTDRDSVVWECQGQRVWPLGDTSWNGPLHIPRWTVIDKNSGTEQSHWNGRPHAVEKNTTVEIIAPPRPRPLKRSIYGAAAQTGDDTSNCWSSNWGLSFTCWHVATHWWSGKGPCLTAVKSQVKSPVIMWSYSHLQSIWRTTNRQPNFDLLSLNPEPV